MHNIQNAFETRTFLFPTRVYRDNNSCILHATYTNIHTGIIVCAEYESIILKADKLIKLTR